MEIRPDARACAGRAKCPRPRRQIVAAQRISARPFNVRRPLWGVLVTRRPPDTVEPRSAWWERYDTLWLAPRSMRHRTRATPAASSSERAFVHWPRGTASRTVAERSRRRLPPTHGAPLLRGRWEASTGQACRREGPSSCAGEDSAASYVAAERDGRKSKHAAVSRSRPGRRRIRQTDAQAAVRNRRSNRLSERSDVAQVTSAWPISASRSMARPAGSLRLTCPRPSCRAALSNLDRGSVTSALSLGGELGEFRDCQLVRESLSSI